jgi:hypothetical protein
MVAAAKGTYLSCGMKIKRLQAGFVVPARPVMAPTPPTGADWVHESSTDGYRLIVRRDGLTVRLYTRNGGVEGIRDGRLGKRSPKRGPAGVGEPRFKAFGERPRQSPTAGWSILYRLLSADGRILASIEPSSQADRAFNPTYRPEPIWVSVTSHRNTSAERKPHGITCNAEG